MTILVYADIQGYQNEMAELVRTFFPGHPVKLIDNIPDDLSDLYMICCTHKIIEKELEITILIYSKGNQVAKRVEKSDLRPNNELEYRKILKNAMKLALYDLLKEYTGIDLEWGAVTGIRPTKIVNELMDDGLNTRQIMEVLYQQYRISKRKSDLLIRTVEVQRSHLSQNNDKKISVYINIPICSTKCLYCSFPSDTIDKCGFMIDDYVSALIKELKQFSFWMKERNIKVESVYMGGGTPTSLNIDQLDRVLRAVEDLIMQSNSDIKEYTVEGGRPDSMDRQKLLLIRSHGVKRISINPQTMNRRTLSLIGRSHTLEQTIDCFQLAREVGFETINMDVIVGLPEEDENDVAYTIDQIKRLKPDNLTVHTLAIKRASILKDSLKEYSFPDVQTANRMLEVCHKGARDMGMIPYYLYRQKYMLGNMENVGYALPGKECIYNIQIMEERQSIWAFGAGAITKVYYPESNRIERIPNVKNIKEYIDRIDEMIQRKESGLMGENVDKLTK